jgi:hypothetical protein
VKTHYRFKNMAGHVIALDLDYGRVELEPGADFDIPAAYALPTPGASPQNHRPSVIEMLCGDFLKPIEPLPTQVVNGKKVPVLYRPPAPADSKGNRSVQRVPAQSTTRVPSAAQLAAEEADRQVKAVRAKAKAEAAAAD